MIYYATYVEAYNCIRKKLSFTHTNGDFRSNGNEILNGAEVIGRYNSCGYIEMIGEPTSQRTGKMYAMMNKYNNYLDRRTKRETIRRN